MTRCSSCVIRCSNFLAVTDNHDNTVWDTVLSIVIVYTLEPGLKDQPIVHKNMVSQDRLVLVTVSFALKKSFIKGGTFCQEYVVFQVR